MAERPVFPGQHCTKCRLPQRRSAKVASKVAKPASLIPQSRKCALRQAQQPLILTSWAAQLRCKEKRLDPRSGQ